MAYMDETFQVRALPRCVCHLTMRFAAVHPQGRSMTVPTVQFLGLEQSIADEAKANALLLKEKFEKNKELNEKFKSK
jgi:hypothetical protein